MGMVCKPVGWCTGDGAPVYRASMQVAHGWLANVIARPTVGVLLGRDSEGRARPPRSRRSKSSGAGMTAAWLRVREKFLLRRRSRWSEHYRGNPCYPSMDAGPPQHLTCTMEGPASSY